MRTLLTTPTPDLETSVAFYRDLGFAIQSEKPPVFSDGQTLLEVDADRFARPGFKLFRPDWQGVVDDLGKLVHLNPTDDGWLLADPSGVRIRLINGDCPYPAPDPATDAPPTALGTFAGISLESADFERSKKIWQLLGFEPGEHGGDGWAPCLGPDGLSVTIMKPLMCPHLFFNPSLTYFNSGKNLEIIQGLRERGVRFAEEVTHFNKEGLVDNVILRDPGGWGIFVFND